MSGRDSAGAAPHGSGWVRDVRSLVLSYALSFKVGEQSLRNKLAI